MWKEVVAQRNRASQWLESLLIEYGIDQKTIIDITDWARAWKIPDGMPEDHIVAQAIKVTNAAQEEVLRIDALMHNPELYFRDSYNGTNVLNLCGLSWWSDVVPMCVETDDEERHNNLPAAACQTLADSIEKSVFPEITKEWLESHNCLVEDEGENSPAGWQAYFEEKRAALIRFLRRAVEHGGCLASL